MQISGYDLPRTKDDMESAYASILAPFATHRAIDNSRDYEDELDKDKNRSDFQRDRDRIIHSKAFRRLMYKTQVFVNHEGDHFRTRLTHTLEVAQLARGVCKSLALNEELSEAIALGHDLGHTPFGHAVERYLDEELIARNIGKFFHNEQSVRVVDFIERRSNEYWGLNLTTEVREGILKHNRDYSGIYQNLNPGKPCSFLEGQVVGLVDTLAYICHDLQDGIESGLIERAMKNNGDIKAEVEEMLSIIGELTGTSIDIYKMQDTYFIDKLIHRLVMSVTEQSYKNILQYKVADSKQVSALSNEGTILISLGEKEKSQFKTLKDLVYKTVYSMNTIQIMDSKAVMVVGDLFQAFLDNPKLLPPDIYYKYSHVEHIPHYKGLVNNEVHVICDYLACMTDRFALEEHERIRNPRIKI